MKSLKVVGLGSACIAVMVAGCTMSTDCTWTAAILRTPGSPDGPSRGAGRPNTEALRHNRCYAATRYSLLAGRPNSPRSAQASSLHAVWSASLAGTVATVRQSSRLTYGGRH